MVGRHPKVSAQSRRRYFIAGLCIVVLLAFGAYFLLKPDPQTDIRPAGAETQVRSSPAPDSLLGWENSIAVLPFRDLSPAGDQEHFCVGMTDALNSLLSRDPALKVISTTSVIRYKETSKDIKVIGSELGVAHILEGTIQREADRIRVTAQLISAEDGFHMWSETYDQQVASLFDVQDKIIHAISRQLRLAMGMTERPAADEMSPASLEAYEYYMKGRHLINCKYTIYFREEDFRTAVDMYRRAIEIDPEYALAYIGLAWAFEHHRQVTGAESDREQIRLACAKAYELAPDSAITNATLGFSLIFHEHQIDSSFRHFKRAMAINPNLAEVNFLTAMFYFYLGLYEEAIPLLERSMELDPYYFWAPYKTAICYMESGDLDSAIRNFDKYFELAPVVMMYAARYVAAEIGRQNYRQVEELIDRMKHTHPEYKGFPLLNALLLAAQGHRDEALAVSKTSRIYGLLGMPDEALASLDTEIRGTRSEPLVFYLVLKHSPYYQKLHGDPRFEALVAREKTLFDEYREMYGLDKMLNR
jgi:TolB-like protein/Tfp pilus assembly protein PilF